MNRNVYLDEFDINEYGLVPINNNINRKIKRYALIADHVFLQCSSPLKLNDVYTFILNNKFLIRKPERDNMPVICFPLSRDILGYNDYFNNRVDKILRSVSQKPEYNGEFKAYSENNAKLVSKQLDSIIPLYNIKRKEISVDKIFRIHSYRVIFDKYHSMFEYSKLNDIGQLIKLDPFFQTFYFKNELKKFNIPYDLSCSMVKDIRNIYYLSNKLSLGITDQESNFIFLENCISKILDCIGIIDDIDKLSDIQILKIRDNENYKIIINKCFNISNEIELLNMDKYIYSESKKYYFSKTLFQYIIPLFFSLFRIDDIATAMGIFGSLKFITLLDPIIGNIQGKIITLLENELEKNYYFMFQNIREFKAFYKKEIIRK